MHTKDYLVSLLREGRFDEWNELTAETIPDLSEVSLPGIDFHGESLGAILLLRGDFSGANFSNCEMESSHLEMGNFSKANFENAHLVQAVMCDSNFRNASFRGANIRGGFLFNSDITGADLTDSSMDRDNFETFSVAMLATVKGLETVRGLPHGLYADVLWYRREMGRRLWKRR
ncbi:MAG TPA: pentapeptide repeat-containing protein [Candidatus Magasanikbacteria bacterium]|nr:pentapeptide repeat-containing protein [Candidatus Magasanikbacteria bacterium]